MKKYLVFFIVFLLAQTGFSTRNFRVFDGDSINQISKDGKKQGYWVEHKNNLRFEMYYLDNVLNGLYKSFYQNNSIAVLGFYSKGEMVSDWYYFDEKGRLIMLQSKITKAPHQVGSSKSDIHLNNSAYLKYYYGNGTIKEEGFAYYNEVEEHIQKFGNWKVYDTGGKLSGTEKFPK